VIGVWNGRSWFLHPVPGVRRRAFANRRSPLRYDTPATFCQAFGSVGRCRRLVFHFASRRLGVIVFFLSPRETSPSREVTRPAGANVKARPSAFLSPRAPRLRVPHLANVAGSLARQASSDSVPRFSSFTADKGAPGRCAYSQSRRPRYTGRNANFASLRENILPFHFSAALRASFLW
jgi:hypothetical protein